MLDDGGSVALYVIATTVLPLDNRNLVRYCNDGSKLYKSTICKYFLVVSIFLLTFVSSSLYNTAQVATDD